MAEMRVGIKEARRQIQMQDEDVNRIQQAAHHCRTQGAGAQKHTNLKFLTNRIFRINFTYIRDSTTSIEENLKASGREFDTTKWS